MISNRDKIAIAISEYKSYAALELIMEHFGIDTVFTYSSQTLNNKHVQYINMLLNWYGIVLACDKDAAEKCKLYKRRYISVDETCNTLEELTRRIEELK